MANYDTEAVIQPLVPEHLIDAQMQQKLKECGITCDLDNGQFYPCLVPLAPRMKTHPVHYSS